MAKLRTDEEVLNDAMNIFKSDPSPESSAPDDLMSSSAVQEESPEERVQDRPQTAEHSPQSAPPKRRHMGEVQRLRIANEQAEQRAMQKAFEAEELRRELESQKVYNAQLMNHAQELKESYADGILEASEQELVSAIESGDTERIGQLFAKQREITKIMAKQTAEKVTREAVRDNTPEYRQEYSDYNANPPRYDNTPQDNPEYLTWLDKTDERGNRINAWADPYDTANYSPELVNEALDYAEDLNKVLKKRGMGHHIGSVEYYDIISNALDDKHGLSNSDSDEREPQVRQPSRPTSYAPVNNGAGGGSSYIAPRKGSKYTINPEISSFISTLPMRDPNMSDEQKYEVFMKYYDQDQKNQKRRQ